MDILAIVATVTASGAIASGLVSLLTMWRYRKGRAGEETVEQRISRLTTSLRDATQLIGQIETEIENRQALVDKLQGDIETYRQITELNQSEVEAVAQLLRGELRKEGQRSFWRNVAINFGFFLLGAVVSGLLIALL